MYELKKDGELKFTGSQDECFIKLQRLQSQSAVWAIRYEGWSIEPSEEEE